MGKKRRELIWGKGRGFNVGEGEMEREKCQGREMEREEYRGYVVDCNVLMEINVVRTFSIYDKKKRKDKDTLCQ